LLISRSQFVSLQISKIEPICVTAWAAETIVAGVVWKRTPVNAGGDVAACVRDGRRLAARPAVIPAASIPEAAADSRENS
jgi:hypothetical protein